MPIPEAKIFLLCWHENKDNAQKPQKGDLIALVQQARVTHIVELLDDTVYENAVKEWGIYRVVQAVWMPPQGVAWSNLPHQQKIFGIKGLAQDGDAHDLSRTDRMDKFNQHWQNLGGLQGFQQHLGEILSQIS